MDHADNQCYNPKDLIPITDPKSGKFLDFALKTGSPLITDYSRIEREIVVEDTVENAVISLGSQKEKNKIKTFDGLKKKTEGLISLIYAINDSTNAYMNRKYRGIPPIEILYNNGDTDKKVKLLLTDQIIFDILYDKYKHDSPRITLNDYCVKHIRYEWHNLIFDPPILDKRQDRRKCINNATLKSIYPKVAPSLFQECLMATLPEFSKFMNAKININVADHFQNHTSDIILKRIEKKIRNNNLLQEDCKKFHGRHKECPEICPEECKKHLKEFLTSLTGKLVSKKDAIYRAMIEEIERETDIMNSPESRENALKLGIDPDIYNKYLSELNKPGERKKTKPKFVWDYLYYNGSLDLITSNQYRRNFERSSNKTFGTFIENFNSYDSFVEVMLPKDEDNDYDYFCKSMDFYHLEIYKRLDFNYKLAIRLEKAIRMKNIDLDSIDKKYFLLRRFHPCVFWPFMDEANNCPRYDEKNKYYRPLLFIEEMWQEQNLLDDDIHNRGVSDTFYLIRAKAYELFNYYYEYDSNDYEDISNFIRRHYNVQSYHEKNKEWYCIGKNEKKKNYTRVKIVEKINNALFSERKKVNISIDDE